MKKFEEFGMYVIQYFPRKGIYRAFKRFRFGDYEYFNGQRDFKSSKEIKDVISRFGTEPRGFLSNDPYNTAIRWLRTASKDDKDYKLVECLTGQYYYGTTPKKELVALLKRMGVLNNC